MSASSKPDDIASFFVIKHSWKGKYKRVFVLNPRQFRTLNPSTLEVTNEWPIDSVVELIANARIPNEFQFVFKRHNKSGNDSMRFSCDWRSVLIEEGNRVLAKPLQMSANEMNGLTAPANYLYTASKISGVGGLTTEKAVSIRLVSWGVEVYAGASLNSTYRLSKIEKLVVCSRENIVRLVTQGFGRSHTFRFSLITLLNSFVAAFSALKLKETGVELSVSRVSEISLDDKFGARFITAESQASLSEFSVYKSDSKQRIFCLAMNCLLERDPKTYEIHSLTPYASIRSIYRCPTDMRMFELIIEANEQRDKRVYASSDRDNLLVALLDAARASGNTNVHVHSYKFMRSLIWAPVGDQVGAEIEEIHLRLLLSSNDELRFVMNVSHNGPSPGTAQFSVFSESRDRLVASALAALVNTDVERTPVQIELQFLAIRRLLCCQAGFECFSAMPHFRECLGKAVSRAIKCEDAAAAYAAIEVLNLLMQPINESDDTSQDLIREQANKKFILHSTRFLDSLLNRLSDCVKSGTSSLVVCSLLDFFTFALCAPFCETTDGAQFENILRLVVSNSSRTFYLLVDHPSLTVRKGAALILKALIEESKCREYLISLALTEGAFLSHLSTALFGAMGSGGDRTFVRKLSRSLLDLWTMDGTEGQTYLLLKRIFPAGLLQTLTDIAAPPPNAKDFVEDCLSENPPLKIERDNVETAFRMSESPALKALLFIERNVNRALNHWRLRLLPPSSISSNLVVLRRKRPRPADACTLNWPLFFFAFYQDHAKPDLIWDFKTRRELKDRLCAEYTEFIEARSLVASTTEVAWNFDEFFIPYKCLADEVKIGNYYLRLLLLTNENSADFIEPLHFFNQLYHKFLLAPAVSQMRRMCAHALSIVYRASFQEIGWFTDVPYILNILDKGTNGDCAERDHILDLIHALSNHRQNALDIVFNRGVSVLLNLAPLCHLHVDRATFAAPILQSAMIEYENDHSSPDEWYCYGSTQQSQTAAASGPFSGSKIIEMFQSNEINGQSRLWAAGLDAWKPMERITQFYWTCCCCSSTQKLKTDSELTVTILSTLIKLCEFFPSRHKASGAVIRPLPKLMTQLTEPTALATLAQLTLTFDPTILEKVATLLSLLIEDNPCISRLYTTGIFFFFLMYQGSNLKPIASFLYATHLKQAFKANQSSSSDITLRSILYPLLPDAMIYFLDNYGPEKFSDAFLGECQNPEIIWNAELRRHLISQIALHIYDYSPRLKSNIYAPFQYCPIPKIEYPAPLKHELFCNQFYLTDANSPIMAS